MLFTEGSAPIQNNLKWTNISRKPRPKIWHAFEGFEGRLIPPVFNFLTGYSILPFFWLYAMAPKVNFCRFLIVLVSQILLEFFRCPCFFSEWLGAKRKLVTVVETKREAEPPRKSFSRANINFHFFHEMYFGFTGPVRRKDNSNTRSVSPGSRFQSRPGPGTWGARVR